MSRRERMLAAGMALVALLLAPLKAYDWSQSQLSSLLADKAALQAASAQDNPAQIRRMSRALADERTQVSAWGWAAPSFQVARVLLEQQVAIAAVQSGVAHPQVTSAEQPQVAGPVQFVKVELSGPFTWPSFSTLTQRLAGLGHGYLVDSVSLQSSGEGAQFRLVALMPFVTPSKAVTR